MPQKEALPIMPQEKLPPKLNKYDVTLHAYSGQNWEEDKELFSSVNKFCLNTRKLDPRSGTYVTVSEKYQTYVLNNLTANNGNYDHLRNRVFELKDKKGLPCQIAEKVFDEFTIYLQGVLEQIKKAN